MLRYNVMRSIHEEGKRGGGGGGGGGGRGPCPPDLFVGIQLTKLADDI